LITAIQRLPRYVLLLSDLLDATPTTHPDFAPLKEAVAKMKAVTEFINAEKRTHENIRAATALFKEFGMECRPEEQRQLFYQVEIFKDIPPQNKIEQAALKKRYKIFFLSDIVIIQKTFTDSPEMIIKTFDFTEITLGRPMPGATIPNRFRFEGKSYYLQETKQLIKMIEIVSKNLKELQFFKEDIDEEIQRYHETNKQKKKKKKKGLKAPRPKKDKEDKYGTMKKDKLAKLIGSDTPPRPEDLKFGPGASLTPYKYRNSEGKGEKSNLTPRALGISREKTEPEGTARPPRPEHDIKPPGELPVKVRQMLPQGIMRDEGLRDTL